MLVNGLQFQRIQLSDRPLFDAAYRSCRHEGSESSFTNLFIWREPLDIVWTRIGNSVCVVVRQDGPVYALHPCAPEREQSVQAARLLAQWFDQQGQPLLIKGLELGLAEMLAEVAGRVPLLIEIKDPTLASGADVGALLGALQNGTAVPMAAVIAGCGAAGWMARRVWAR